MRNYSVDYIPLTRVFPRKKTQTKKVFVDLGALESEKEENFNCPTDEKVSFDHLYEREDRI